MTDTQREFDEWWDADRLTQTNPYRKDTPIWWAWEGFQAALAHSQKRDLPAKKPEHEWNQGSDYPSRDSYADGYANGWNDCIDAITNRKDE